MTASYTPRRTGFAPREGGVLGVWAASLVYGLAYSRRTLGDPLVAYSMALAVASLLASGRAWRSPPGRPRLVVVAPIALGYSVLAILAPDPLAGLSFAAAGASLLAVAVYGSGLQVILAGGPLLAHAGAGLVLAAGGGPVEALLPTAYSIVTVSIASARVTGEYEYLSVPVALGSLAVGLAGVYICQYCGLSGGLVLVDVLARLIPYPLRVYSRVGLRAYGFHEAFRSTLVMALAGLCL